MLAKPSFGATNCFNRPTTCNRFAYRMRSLDEKAILLLRYAMQSLESLQQRMA